MSTKDGKTSQQNIGTISTGSTLDSTVLDLRQGGINTTGNPLDMAINGNGFFTIKTPNGLAYTRNGSFIRLNDGTLATNQGYPVMGEKGEIKLSLEKVKSKDVLVDENGTVRLKDQVLDKLKIVDFNNKKSLTQIGNSLMTSATGERPKAANGCKVVQGGVETSNANVVECMVSSITGSRIYESLAKVIETDNRTLSKTVNDVGRMKR
jgi:flagellar basal-body rod protein FlgG